MKKRIILIITIAVLVSVIHFNVMAAESGQDHPQAGIIKLTPAQIKHAGIVSKILRLRPTPRTVHAPGTVAFNDYLSADVTTVVDAIVHARFVRLGNHVKKGDRLVTLTSTTLAQAQAAYLRAKAEHHRSKQAWIRLKKLAQQNIVSQARLQQADSTYQAMRANLAAAKATLFSYGLSKQEISGLLDQSVYGLLTLRAANAGTVVADNFRIGQHLAAGSRLMQIVDESHVWVEVKVPETQWTAIRIGQSAFVMPKGDKHRYSGSVVNMHHQLDAITRTAGVRLNIDNANDRLHPGMFVRADISTGSGEKALLISETSIQGQGRDLVVFVEEKPGYFERREVSVDQVDMGLVAIRKGVKAGESVVIKGAFVLASELAKAGFAADEH